MDISSFIDHTLLKPESSKEDVRKLCEEAKKHHFYSVCVPPCYVRLAKKIVEGSPVKVCTVIGFPLGNTTTAVKVVEAKEASLNGADELDMVINIGFLKDGDMEKVRADIESVVMAGGKPVKVILETCLLTDEEIEKGCKAAEMAGARFIKTSTGFSKGGATIEAVSIMKKAAPALGIKASGGIRTREDALKFIKAGATRIGSSSGAQLL